MTNPFKEKQEEDSMKLYLNDISKIPLLSTEEEVELGKLIKNGDENAKKQLVNANLRYVVSVAKHYQRQGFTLMELIQEGNYGLMEAAERFDYEKGVLFVTYADEWIRKYIRRYIANYTFTIKIPEKKFWAMQKDEELKGRYESEYGEIPMLEEWEHKISDYTEKQLDARAIENTVDENTTSRREYLQSTNCANVKEHMIMNMLLAGESELQQKKFCEKNNISKEEYKSIITKLYRNACQGLHEEGGGIQNKRAIKFNHERSCWEMHSQTFNESAREKKFMKQVAKIKDTSCNEEIQRYLKKCYAKKTIKELSECLKDAYLQQGIPEKKNWKKYFGKMQKDLGETELNELALVTKMRMEEYLFFRKNVAKCVEEDFANFQYVYMYFTLKYAKACGRENLKEAYDALENMYASILKEKKTVEKSQEIQSAEDVGKMIFLVMEDVHQLKPKFKEKLFCEPIPELVTILEQLIFVNKNTEQDTRNIIFKSQWEELRENIRIFDGNLIANEIQYEKDIKKMSESMINGTRCTEDSELYGENFYLGNPKMYNRLYGHSRPEPKEVVLLSAEETACFLDSKEFLRTMITDNTFSQFVKKKDEVKRNLILTLLFLNFSYGLMDERHENDSYEERVYYFEKKVNREMEICGYRNLDSRNAYDAYLKLLLTCSEPLELYQYIWKKKLNLDLTEYQLHKLGYMD